VKGLLDDAAKDGGFTFTIESTIGRYTRAIENLCYRVIQEAVSNVKRHAQASTVTVTMEERNGDIACRVHDDGIGFASSMFSIETGCAST
jgi:signal transduction histidine kinase